jgi:hypothetical protein
VLTPRRSSTTPVQRMITIGKGISIDYDSVSRDAHGQSKELYMWGQGEDEDLKDGQPARSPGACVSDLTSVQ